MPFFIILLFVLVVVLFIKISEYKNLVHEIDLRFNQRIDQLQKKLAEALHEIANLRRSKASEEPAASEKPLEIIKESDSLEIKNLVSAPIQISTPMVVPQEPALAVVREKFVLSARKEN
jgi:hypothetical protein